MRKTKELNTKYKKLNTKNGITLIALIITIILILILASITVTVAINGGLFGYAGKAKQDTEIASEKETLQKASILAESTSKTGRITEEDMQKAINSITEENAATAINNGETIVVKFEESGRYYEIDSKGKISEFTPYEDTTPGELAKNADGYYMIESIEDLVVFSAMANGGYSDDNINISSNKFRGQTVQLMRNLDFKASLSYSDSTTTIYNGYLGIEEENVTLIEALTNEDKYQGFIPIGNSTYIFYGTFDGNGHKISNIYEGTGRAGGLFGCITENASISNISVSGKIISLSGGTAGGIVGTATPMDGCVVKIENCTNEVEVQTAGMSGGILGYKHAFPGTVEIENCCNIAKVIGNDYAGGIVGMGYRNTYIKNCYNAGEIVGTGSKLSTDNCGIGGIIGLGYSIQSIENCYNTGKVTALNSFAGGIMGAFGWSTTIIKNCYNVGEITAAKGGGLIGGGYSGCSLLTVEGCYYLEKITGWGVGTLSTDSATATSESFIKSNDMVTSLNTYIQEGGTNTTDYCAWSYNKGNYPTLNYKNIWNGEDWEE